MLIFNKTFNSNFNFILTKWKTNQGNELNGINIHENNLYIYDFTQYHW